MLVYMEIFVISNLRLFFRFALWKPFRNSLDVCKIGLFVRAINTVHCHLNQVGNSSYFTGQTVIDSSGLLLKWLVSG